MGKLDSKIEITKVTKENLKEGLKVRIAPSVDIIRFIFDAVAENGIAGVAVKDKNDKLFISASINIIADAEGIIEHEMIFEEPETKGDENKKTEKHESA